MLQTAFVVFRELIELAIMFGAIHKIFSKTQNFYMSFYKGIILGFLFSILLCSLLPVFAQMNLEIFKIFTFVISFFMMLWAVLTMDTCEVSDDAIYEDISILYLSFITAFREMNETLLFVITFHFKESLTLYQSIESIFIGLVPGLFIGMLSYFSIIRLQSPIVLTVLHFVLTAITANLCQESLSLIANMFNIDINYFLIADMSFLLSENSVLGMILNLLFGYKEQVISYEIISFWSVIFFVYIYRFFFKKNL